MCRLLACTMLLLLFPPIGAVAKDRGQIIALSHGARAYLPASHDGKKPAPLLVLLHGAGGTPEGMIEAFRLEAGRQGVILLAAKSRGLTWDMIDEVRANQSPSYRPRLSIDPPRIDAAVIELAAKVPLDRRRIGLAGFSDGASYALTLGLANPDVFSWVLAFSPGMVFRSSTFAPRSCVFVAHGRSDRVLPYANTVRRIIPQLEGAERLVFEPFPGDHEMPAGLKKRGMALFAEQAC